LIFYIPYVLGGLFANLTIPTIIFLIKKYFQKLENKNVTLKEIEIRNDENNHKEEPFEIQVFIKDTFVILLGIAFATVGLELFVVPNKLLDGGVTGISLLLSFVTKLDVSIFIFTINMPFVYMGYKQVGKIFAIKTFLAIVTLSIVLYAMHSLHPTPITQDKVLIAVFGGICLGAGIGFAMRGGCVLDGTEVLALWLTRKSSMQVGEIILIINILIFANG